MNEVVQYQIKKNAERILFTFQRTFCLFVAFVASAAISRWFCLTMRITVEEYELKAAPAASSSIEDVLLSNSTKLSWPTCEPCGRRVGTGEEGGVARTYELTCGIAPCQKKTS